MKTHKHYFLEATIKMTYLKRCTTHTDPQTVFLGRWSEC